MNGGSEILWTRFGQLGLLVEQAEDSGALGLDQINAILQNNKTHSFVHPTMTEQRQRLLCPMVRLGGWGKCSQLIYFSLTKYSSFVIYLPEWHLQS